jgi:hypothetical protein
LHSQIQTVIQKEAETPVKSYKTNKKAKETIVENVQEIILPDLEEIDFSSSNGEEFLSKHWIELMEV